MFCWWVVSFESRKDAFIIMLATPPLTCFDDIMDTITEDVEESVKKKFPNLKQVLMPGHFVRYLGFYSAKEVEKDLPFGQLSQTEKRRYNVYVFSWGTISGPVLTGSVAQRLKQEIDAQAKTYGWEVLRLSISPEFVSVIMAIPLFVEPHRVMKKVLWKSEEALKTDFPELFSEKPPWKHTAYYVEAWGVVSPKELEEYKRLSQSS